VEPELSGYENEPRVEYSSTPPLKRSSSVFSAANLKHIFIGSAEPSLPLEPSMLEFLSLDPLKVAQHLIMTEFTLFQGIPPVECVLYSPNSPPPPNIQAFVTRFNQVSNWVAMEIVTTPNLKKRTAVMKRFIMIAEKSVKLNSFNTALEIIAGLNMISIQRLKKTWKGLQSKTRKKFDRLEELLSHHQNYQLYRETLRFTPVPALPYFGLFMRDLAFTDAGNQTFLENNKINMTKMAMIASIVKDIQHYQKVPFTFKLNQLLEQYLKHHTQPEPPIDETSLEKFSIGVEPGIHEIY